MRGIHLIMIMHWITHYQLLKSYFMEQRVKLILDPRTKLFILLLCVIAASLAPSLLYGAGLVVLIGVMGILCGYWRTVGCRSNGHTEDNPAGCVWAVSQGISLRYDGRLVYHFNKGERIFICDAPAPRSQKDCYSACSDDSLFPHNR